MRLFPIYQMGLYGVADAGVPNQERVILRPTQQTNLAEYCVCLGFRTPDESTVPLRDYFYWFGDRVVEPPSWIMLYTGPGEFTESRVASTGEPVYSFHWNHQHTVFGPALLTPVLFHVDSVAIGPHSPRLGYTATKQIT